MSKTIPSIETPDSSLSGILGETQKLRDVVENSFSRWIADNAAPLIGKRRGTSPEFVAGKMLRTRLACRLLATNPSEELLHTVHNCCLATELVHAASLYHDDVIDGASLRRGAPTMWRRTGANGSVLIGDLLLCGALSFIGRLQDSSRLTEFVAAVHETCAAEIEQELVHRGSTLTTDQCLAIARGKTGPLFGFVASSCDDGRPGLREALREAGYAIGTAYQLADDLADEEGNEQAIGKSLGTDRLRRKYTLAHGADHAGARVSAHIQDLCGEALRHVEQWPEIRAGLRRFVDADLRFSAR